MRKMNKVFLLHATKEWLTTWPHDAQGNIMMSGRDVAGLSYRVEFSAPDAHLNWVFYGSFVAWLLFPMGLRFFNRSTAKINKDEHLRGARLITENEMAAKNDGTGILRIGKINEHKAALVTLSSYRQHEAVVAIVLGNGSIFTHIFEMRRAREMLGGWRSLYGTPLIVDRRPCSNLRKRHPELIDNSRRT
jgi:hypothetical protein